MTLIAALNMGTRSKAGESCVKRGLLMSIDSLAVRDAVREIAHRGGSAAPNLGFQLYLKLSSDNYERPSDLTKTECVCAYILRMPELMYRIIKGSS